MAIKDFVIKLIRAKHCLSLPHFLSGKDMNLIYSNRIIDIIRRHTDQWYLKADEYSEYHVKCKV